MAAYAKEVYFDEYCESCKHAAKKGYEDPCNECLNNFFNYDSHKPTEYVPAEKA